MELNEEGYLRPVVTGPPDEQLRAGRVFRRVCPGRQVVASRPAASTRHPLFGPYIRTWEAWAVDPEVRDRGSSGGVLTAINGWLLESGTATVVSTAAADPSRPVRTVPVQITSKEEALASAGSRYAPVGIGANLLRGPDNAITAKPCEVAAVRALSAVSEDDAPILLSFFCAGTPSQWASEQLIRDLGGPEPDEVTELRYRGQGWPGRFTARFAGGEVSTDYRTSWGKSLGPTAQWRCKICPDGVGESADITAADSWEVDERGYPVFREQEGRSALLARTKRGLDIILAAEAANVIELRPLDLSHLVRAQPSQTKRRQFLAGRLWGARLGGRPVPRFRGFGLTWLALSDPLTAARTLRGTQRRVRNTLKGGI